MTSGRILPPSQITNEQGPNSRYSLPWHRDYLYFYERILGKLIGDDNFSIPFWSEAYPGRKSEPDFYNQTPIIIDHDSNPNFSEYMEHNLKQMYRSNHPGGGSTEQILHWPSHEWLEEPADSNINPMGNFYSSSRNYNFLGCSSNVDRMWSAWEAHSGAQHRDYDDPDWLDASFYLYDENQQIVRMKVKDCLDMRKLGYEYQKGEINV